jgi:hypothetical protein
MRAAGIGLLFVSLAWLVTFSVATPAFAEDPSAPSQVGEVEGYDVDFTLPTASRAGCLVCHGDESLVRERDGQAVSYHVDTEELAAGPHADVQCMACHIDFAFVAPHSRSSENWDHVSRLACKNCHQQESRAYWAGVHRGEVEDHAGDAPEGSEFPLCGDCHGGHDVQALTDDPEGRRALRDDGWNVCGRCHEDYWESYDDYYHGRAYKQGAPDAPACWDCHGYHGLYPSSDARSSVHENRLADTCEGCHRDVNEGYLQYAELIHGRRDVLEDNPLYSLIRRIGGAITGLFGG